MKKKTKAVLQSGQADQPTIISRSIKKDDCIKEWPPRRPLSRGVIQNHKWKRVYPSTHTNAREFLLQLGFFFFFVGGCCGRGVFVCVLHLGSVRVDFSKLVSDNETRTTHFPSPGRVRQKVMTQTRWEIRKISPLLRSSMIRRPLHYWVFKCCCAADTAAEAAGRRKLIAHRWRRTKKEVEL